MLPELNTTENLKRTIETEKRKKKTYRVTEVIASRDHNNLYINSSVFKDRLKYKAFNAIYAVMRIVDNRNDNLLLLVKQSGLIFLKKCAQMGFTSKWDFWGVFEGIYCKRYYNLRPKLKEISYSKSPIKTKSCTRYDVKYWYKF